MEWEAYDRLDPIGSVRDDWLHAHLACLITNLAIAIHGKKSARRSQPKDFLPNWSGERKKQTVAEMKQVLQRISDHFRRKDK